MMDNATFYWCSKQEYQKRLFPNQQEYDRIENMYLACKTLLHGNLQYMHPKTIKFRDVYKHEILDNICELPGPREKFGRLLPMKQIRDNAGFQKKFHEHEDFLMNLIRENYWRPGEAVVSDWEIIFLLYNHPEIIEYIYNQTRSMQEILATRAPYYLKQPGKNLVDCMNADQVQSVPREQRGIDFEVCALVQYKLPVSDIHCEQLPQFVKTQMVETLDNKEIKTLLCAIEKLGVRVFGDSIMENMRLTFIDKDKWDCRPQIDGFMSVGGHGLPFVAYMKNPSKKVKEASVKKNPYAVGAIKYQYDAIQELALRVMAEKRQEYFNQFEQPIPSYNNPWNFQVLRLMLKRPSVKIEKLYMDLVQSQR